MGIMERKAFPRGWTPDADAVEAPAGTLLRGDNLILDEQNVLSLRRGIAKINSPPFSDLDVHSLHTQLLSGTRYRMAGIADKVYANGVALSPTMLGTITDTVSFGTHMGQIFFARDDSKYKYDGTTVRNWGVLMSGTAATATGIASGSGDLKEWISFDSTESPALIWDEDNGAGPVYVDGYDGTPNGAAQITSSAATQKGYLAKVFATDQNFNALDGGGISDDDSIVSFWVFVEDVSKVFSVAILFCTGEHFEEDEFIKAWFSFQVEAPSVPGDFSNGWNKLEIRRGDLFRSGGTFGRGWETIRSIWMNVQVQPGESICTVAFDTVTMTGGVGSALDGEYEWAYVYVRDNGSYVAMSDNSEFSVKENYKGQGAEITVPADPNRDPQINQIWLYRRGGTLTDWYRTVVKPITEGDTGPIIINDTIPDQTALDIGIIMQFGNTVPPDNIVGIEGPYYDRLFALTATHLYPSRRLMPDTFSDEQVIRVAGADEIAVWVKKAFNGLYIGTTKDVYRLDGTGAEYPDGTVEWTLTPLNIDNPPRSESVTQEGNLLVFMAADGWRAFAGAGTQKIVGETSLLYQGRDRHGVEAITTSSRFRAAIVRGQLVAITPEGSNVNESQILYRYTFSNPRWYRHTYSPEWRSIFREPDGTLIAGDNAGTIWTLDTGTSDDGSSIPVILWTSRDDDGNGYAPKQAVGFMVNLDSGGGTFTIGLYSNDDDTLIESVSGSTSSTSPTAFDISDSLVWRHVQLRLTGSFTRFRFSGYTIPYLALPMGVKAWDTGPMDLGQQDIAWARRVRMKVRARTDLTVTPFFDGVAFDTVTLEIVEAAQNKVVIVDVPVGRGFFGYVPRLVITSASDFHPYWTEFMFRRTTEETEKPNVRIPSGLGGEAEA